MFSLRALNKLTKIGSFAGNSYANCLAVRSGVVQRSYLYNSNVCGSISKRWFSVSNDPLNNDKDKDAAEAYPMRIIYQKEILKEFEKQQKQKIMKKYEIEIMEESLKGVYPEICEEAMPVEFEETEAQPSKWEAKISSPDLYKSDMFSMEEEDEEEEKASEYEMMVIYKRLKFKQSRILLKENKQRLRSLLGVGKKS